MKDFLTYFKSKFNWIPILITSFFYFLFIILEVYVNNKLSFVFQELFEFSTWAILIFFQFWLSFVFYFVLWRPNRKALLKEKTQESEASSPSKK